MERILTLAHPDGTLRLRTEPSGWCHISLDERTLGADRESIVRARLAAGLRDLTGPVLGQRDGGHVYQVLLLSEERHAIYAGDVSGERRWYVQGPDLSFVATLRFSAEQRATWLASLGFG